MRLPRNHLAGATSPYLLQHAENPVEWYPWCAEAVTRSKQEDRPIFLSIGYAACHWCHVMAHESFENAEIAALLNQHFICIKVDREERPDLDSIYMQAATAMTGSGGWPLSVFLTPDLRPFYAGTYFPSSPRHGLPAFGDVLAGIVLAWQEDREEIEQVGARLADRLTGATDALRVPRSIRDSELGAAVEALLRSHDSDSAGWGEPPKFPQAMALDFLLARAARGGTDRGKILEVVDNSLEAMSRGGMYDVVGGGFSRYSTDAAWHIPHFEKMLYDNVLLGRVYLHAWQLTGNPDYRRIVVDTLGFLNRELRHTDGGYFSSLDADSPDGEGVYYAWSREEIRAVLGADAEVVEARYGITIAGNWEGRTILQRQLDDAQTAALLGMDPTGFAPRLAACHARLLAVRSLRRRPAVDDKVLTSWNGLALAFLAEASRAPGLGDLSNACYDLATRNANFLLSALRPAGILRHSWRDGRTTEQVFLVDYAALILGLLELYQTDFEPGWFADATALAEEMLERFYSPATGFYDTPVEAELLLIRPRDLYDNATPSGAALACEGLLRLAALGNRSDYATIAAAAVGSLADAAAKYPLSFARWLSVADFATARIRQIALIGDPQDRNYQELLRIIRAEFRPHVLTAASALPLADAAPPLLAGRGTVDGIATAHVCEGFVCRLPVTNPEDLLKQLAQ